jgi:hypothetical protein
LFGHILPAQVFATQALIRAGKTFGLAKRCKQPERYVPFFSKKNAPHPCGAHKKI